MKSHFFFSVLLVAVTTAVIAAEADEASRGDSCVDCHGLDGIASKARVPHLNGQLLEYLESSLDKFRRTERPGRAFGHDDAARITELLKHYSTVKVVRPKQPNVNPVLALRGETIYQNRCADCHPDNGRESDKSAALMAGQDLDYLVTQMSYFVDGKRKFAFKMDDSFRGLSTDDLTSVAHFFASQEQQSAKKRRRR